jgi:lipoprotein NlpD
MFAKNTQPLIFVMMLVLFLASCSSRRAPIVDHSGNSRSTTAAAIPVEPGFYRVKRGDTLYRIALENGQSYRDIAQWNNLSNPDQIEVDQVLRVAPPQDRNLPVMVAPVKSNSVDVTPIAAEEKIERNKEKATKEVADKAPRQEHTDPAKEKADISLAWPAKGTLIGFDEVKNKGIDILGKAGDAIKAAGNGKVVYAGNGLRGYGNLVIIKHNSTYLTAYAHNRTLLVKEGEQVYTGQKIAEMGNTDSDRVKLHFEVRRYGKPVDPARYLVEKNL